MFQILAPHPDDAALSVGHTLARLSAAGQRIRIITCFSESAWTTHLPRRGIEAMTAIRRDEDRSYAELLGPACELIDLRGTDAPFRGHYRGRFAFFHDRPFDKDELALRGWLIGRLNEVLSDAPLLLPMALGDHVDHRLALSAGLAVSAHRPLGLYEDVPYVIGKTTEAGDKVAAGVERELKPMLVPTGGHEESVRQGLTLYRSQVNERQAETALGHARARGGGDRLLVDGQMRGALLAFGPESVCKRALGTARLPSD